jgi:Glycosyl hydrolase family 26
MSVRKSRRSALIKALVLSLSVAVIGGCSSSTTTSGSTTTPIPLTKGDKPPIPVEGAYIGAWVDPSGVAADKSTQSGPSTSAALAAAIGRPLGITEDNFVSWHTPMPVAKLQTEAAQGTIGVIDWHCGDLDSNVAAGKDDTIIRNAAVALKNFGKPVFLRWYWEMAFVDNPQTSTQCLGNPHAVSSGVDAVAKASKPSAAQVVTDEAAYIAAWRHIWTIFQQVGATNVAFEWCPGNSNITTLVPKFYPGSQYVDWIGVDVYADATNGVFAKLVAPFYNYWKSYGKPLMISETGAHQGFQAAYLQGVASTLPSQFPDIKAFLYFDGTGPKGNWSLDTAGLAAYKAMANSAYFHPTFASTA